MQSENQNLMCPLRHLINTFGGKWKLPIICILSSGEESKRYSVIKRRLRDITGMMLSQSLHELEDSGLIHREQFNEIPPHVEYSLTEKGKEVLPFLQKAAEWAISDMKKNGINILCDKCASTD